MPTTWANLTGKPGQRSVIPQPRPTAWVRRPLTRQGAPTGRDNRPPHRLDVDGRDPSGRICGSSPKPRPLAWAQGSRPFGPARHQRRHESPTSVTTVAPGDHQIPGHRRAGGEGPDCFQSAPASPARDVPTLRAREGRRGRAGNVSTSVLHQPLGPVNFRASRESLSVADKLPEIWGKFPERVDDLPRGPEESCSRTKDLLRSPGRLSRFRGDLSPGAEELLQPRVNLPADWKILSET